MKNLSKKNLAIIIVSALLLVIVVIVTIISLSRKSKNPPLNTSPNESTTSIELGIDTAKVSLHTVLDVLEQDTANDPAFLTAVDSKNGYEVLSFNQTDTESTALIKVYSPDLYNIAKKLDSDGVARTKEELLEAISNEITNAPLVESQIELEFTVTEDGCVPIITSEFLDALYGGVFRLYGDMLSGN